MVLKPSNFFCFGLQTKMSYRKSTRKHEQQKQQQTKNTRKRKVFSFSGGGRGLERKTFFQVISRVNEKKKTHCLSVQWWVVSAQRSLYGLLALFVSMVDGWWSGSQKPLTISTKLKLRTTSHPHFRITGNKVWNNKQSTNYLLFP